MVPVFRKFCGHSDITWDLFGDPQLGPLPLQGASICPFSQLKNKSKQARKTNKSELEAAFAGLSLAVTACLWRPPPADAHLREQTLFGGQNTFSPTSSDLCPKFYEFWSISKPHNNKNYKEMDESQSGDDLLQSRTGPFAGLSPEKANTCSVGVGAKQTDGGGLGEGKWGLPYIWSQTSQTHGSRCQSVQHWNTTTLECSSTGETVSLMVY